MVTVHNANGVVAYNSGDCQSAMLGFPFVWRSIPNLLYHSPANKRHTV
jgi:hypothetical protein